MSDTLNPQPATTEPTANVTHFDRSAGARILARSFYKELRSSGYAEQDVMTLASELLGLVATDVKTRRTKPE